jgi:hypothetical protein
MSQNRITYDVCRPSWLTTIKIRTLRLALLLAVASGPAFAAPLMGSDDGCSSCDKETVAFHVPVSKASATTGHARCRLPNPTKDDWPAGMILGNADLILTLQYRLNA